MLPKKPTTETAEAVNDNRDGWVNAGEVVREQKMKTKNLPSGTSASKTDAPMAKATATATATAKAMCDSNDGGRGGEKEGGGGVGKQRK